VALKLLGKLALRLDYKYQLFLSNRTGDLALQLDCKYRPFQSNRMMICIKIIGTSF